MTHGPIPERHRAEYESYCEEGSWEAQVVEELGAAESILRDIARWHKKHVFDDSFTGLREVYRSSLDLLDAIVSRIPKEFK